jgi:hypothetical protein
VTRRIEILQVVLLLQCASRLRPLDDVDNAMSFHIPRCALSHWESFRRPCNNLRDRKTEDDDQHDESNDPIRNLEEWKNLRGDLDQKLGDNPVRNCDPVNVTPLQFAEKVVRVHFFPSQVTTVPFRRGVGELTRIVLVSCHDFVSLAVALEACLFVNRKLSHRLSAMMPTKKATSAPLSLETLPTRNRTQPTIRLTSAQATFTIGEDSSFP